MKKIKQAVEDFKDSIDEDSYGVVGESGDGLRILGKEGFWG